MSDLPKCLAASTIAVPLATLSLVALPFVIFHSSAEAAGAFANFTGSWSGNGQMRLEGGRTEALRCKAYYTDKSGGTSLGLSIRCASSASKVELRATLAANGGRVSGSWEERQFNVSGSASGSASGSHLSLAISGGLSGSMSVNTTGARQSVSVTAHNVPLKSIDISLSRD